MSENEKTTLVNCEYDDKAVGSGTATRLVSIEISESAGQGRIEQRNSRRKSASSKRSSLLGAAAALEK